MSGIRRHVYMRSGRRGLAYCLIQAVIFMLLFCPRARPEVAPVVIDIPESTVWTGQRLPIFVELRTRGSFGGATSFDLPQVPGSVILAAGRPTVDTEELEGETWFVQRHEFALFSQRTGTLALPSFGVRYGTRKEYSGPVTEHNATVPSTSVEIKRPPDSKDLGFLITAESVKISESWDPQPGPAKVGDVFKRTIDQSADQMTGMALAAVPTDAPAGVRIYPGQPWVSDDLERGNFIGKRQETISYLMEKSGTVTLAEIRFVWWNPKRQQLTTKILPAVTFEVAPSISLAEECSAASIHRVWPQLLVAFIGVGLFIGLRYRITTWVRFCWTRLNPPDRVAARQLFRACRKDDATSAEVAWRQWLSTQATDFEVDSDLRSAVLNLQRQVFGPTPENLWQGRTFALAFRTYLAITKKHSPVMSASALPALNPSNRTGR